MNDSEIPHPPYHTRIRRSKKPAEKGGASWHCVLEHYENGKRKQIKKRGFTTKKDAQKALVEAENALNTGTYVKPSTFLLKDYLLEWMRDKQHITGRQTAENHWT